jgi:putative ABC transport system permease protein
VFFHWDYFQRTLEGQSRAAPIEVATYALQTAEGVDQVRIQRDVDQLFSGGPQRVNCNTEAEFNAQFVTMLGSVPLFLSAIGGGVLVAVLFACVNTMLMSFREQMHDVGILKALGFTDAAVGGMMLAQSLLVCILGGGLGLLLAKGSEPAFVAMIGAMFPGYAVTPAILGLGAALTLCVGLISAVVPALEARSLAVVTALRSDE